MIGAKTKMVNGKRCKALFRCLSCKIKYIFSGAYWNSCIAGVVLLTALMTVLCDFIDP